MPEPTAIFNISRNKPKVGGQSLFLLLQAKPLGKSVITEAEITVQERASSSNFGPIARNTYMLSRVKHVRHEALTKNRNAPRPTSFALYTEPQP
jgi:hypothetical protein